MGENRYLESWLWSRFCIFLLFLPTRSPEWNPQELVFNLLTRELKCYPIRALRANARDAVAIAAHHVFQTVTHDQVTKMYSKSHAVQFQ
jgi:hypothetical protein